MNFDFLHTKKLAASVFLPLFAVLLMLDVALRLGRFWQLDYQSRDSLAQIVLAKSIASKEYQIIAEIPELREAFAKPPLLPGVMILGEKCGIDAGKSGIVFVLLCGILLPCVLALLAHELFEDWRYTLGTILLAAVFPPLVRYSCFVQRDIPYWFWCAIAVCLAIRAEKKQCNILWAAFGTAAAVAVCTRREGFELILAWGLWLCFTNWTKTGFKKILLHKLGILCNVLIPWLAIALAGQGIWHYCGSSWQVIPLKSLAYYWTRLI